MKLNVKVLETGEDFECEFKRYPNPGDIGTIHTSDGRKILCEAASVPAEPKEGCEDDILGILVQVIEK